MKISGLKNLIKPMKDADQIAIIWFEAEEADEIISGQGLDQLTTKEWHFLVDKFENDNEHFYQITNEWFQELVGQIITNRENDRTLQTKDRK